MQLGLKPCCERRWCFCRMVASCSVTTSTDVVPQGIQYRYIYVLITLIFFVNIFILRSIPAVLLSACPSVCRLSGNSNQIFCQVYKIRYELFNYTHQHTIIYMYVLFKKSKINSLCYLWCCGSMSWFCV